MKYQLLCFDLDGTLLNDKKEIVPQSAEAIRQAAGQGVRIALITGRMPDATDFIADRLQVPCILACNAGSYILDGENCISAEYLSVETMMKVYERIEPYHIPLWIFRNRSWYVTGMDAHVEEEIGWVHHTPEIADIEELADRWKKEKTGPSKVLIGADPQIVKAVYAELGQEKWQDVDMACSADNFLEIYPKGINKGRALRLICEKLEIKKEQTIAFGDQELDIPMIEEAGVGIAMGNAIDELKQKADYVTGTNNETGIADALEHYLG